MNPERRILVPLDGSKGAENAIGIAASLAGVYGASLDLVHVLDPAETSAEFLPAETAFREYGARLIADRPLPASTRVRLLAGPAAQTLIDESAHAEMVVMATHGRGGFRAMFIGSVADKVVRSCERPVMLVPAFGDPSATPRVILVPLDGSELAEQALPVARRLAEAFGSRIYLVRAFNPVVATDIEFGYYNVPLSLSDDIEEYLKGIARPGEGYEVFEADATSAIVAVAQDQGAELVVMTSSGKGLTGRLLLGSITDRVMRTVHRPTLILRPS